MYSLSYSTVELLKYFIIKYHYISVDFDVISNFIVDDNIICMFSIA